MTGDLGQCAVAGCEEQGIAALVYLGTPVARVCIEHDTADLSGYVLRTGVGSEPVIFPPGSEIPWP